MHSREHAGLLVSLLSLPVVSALGTAMAAAPNQVDSDQQAQMQARAVETRQRLAREADRLEIRASQQGPWGTYEAAIRSLSAQRGPTGPQRTASTADQDPAARLREAAQRASERARQLTQLADATSKLWAVLSPDQRAVFVESLLVPPPGDGGPGLPPPPRRGGGPDDRGPPGRPFGGIFSPPWGDGPGERADLPPGPAGGGN